MDKSGKRASPFVIRLVVACYAVGVLVLVLLSISNYPVQWRDQVNKERQRYLEVFAQALEYYKADHDGVPPPLPSEPALISNNNQCSFECPILGRTLACFNLAEVLVPAYMQKLIRDPLINSDQNTGFYLSHDQGTLTLGACSVFFNKPVLLQKPL